MVKKLKVMVYVILSLFILCGVLILKGCGSAEGEIKIIWEEVGGSGTNTATGSGTGTATNTDTNTNTLTNTNTYTTTGTNTNTDTGTIADGAQLYASHCAACHGELASSTKKGRSADHIKVAIQSVGPMQFIKLTDEEISAVAAALGGDATYTSTITDTNTTTNTGTTKTLTSITVVPDGNEVMPGDTLQFSATGHYSDGSEGAVSATWSTSDSNTATIDSSGVALVKSDAIPGASVTINAKSGSITGSATLYVRQSSPY